jgi:hypothetical protein
VSTSLEVTTVIGCPGTCRKYCAQEVFLEKYGDRARLLTVENWRRIIEHIPPSIPIWFGAFSEPLKNPDCIRFAEIAAEHGNEIAMYTTLFGATDNQINDLVKLYWKAIVVHLPDGIHLRVPNEAGYRDRLSRVLTSVANVQTMKMNSGFKSIHREEILRGNPVSDRHVVTCSRDVFSIYQPTMLPDGVVHPCCVDMNLNFAAGNLLTEDWQTITARITQLKPFMLNGLCRYCPTWGYTRKQKTVSQIRKVIRGFVH